MWTRIITAVVALAAFIPCLLFAPDWALMLLFGLLAAVAVYEVADCTFLKDQYFLTIGSIGCVFLHVSFSQITYMVPAVNMNWFDYFLFNLPGIVLLLLFLLYIAAGVVRYEKLPAEKLCLQGFFCLYLMFTFSALGSLLIDGYYLSTEYSLPFGERTLLWIAFCVPWIADTLAYFTGRFLGKHKLCPNISPKKTVEGAVGGVVSTGIVAVLLYGFTVAWSVIPLILISFAAMLLAVVSIFGDLFASAVKRRFGVKDYGKIFPGHGGVLDRFDSTLPVALALQLIIAMVYLW